MEIQLSLWIKIISKTVLLKNWMTSHSGLQNRRISLSLTMETKELNCSKQWTSQLAWIFEAHTSVSLHFILEVNQVKIWTFLIQMIWPQMVDIPWSNTETIWQGISIRRFIKSNQIMRISVWVRSDISCRSSQTPLKTPKRWNPRILVPTSKSQNQWSETNCVRMNWIQMGLQVITLIWDQKQD